MVINFVLCYKIIYFLEKEMPEVILNGPHGRIECRYHTGQSSDSPIAMILHPEPNHGGSMNNKISYGMYHEFRNRGFSVLRFNFRGVGRSEGMYEGGEGELADAAAALDEKGVSGEGRVAVLNPRQYYELIQNVESNGLINRNERGDAIQSGNGIIEIAGITIYKSMNIPFFGNFGTKYGSGSATNPGVTDPGNSGSFVEEAMGDDHNVTVNDYGQQAKFNNSCGLIFQKEAAAVVEAIGPQVQVTSGDISVVYQGDVILGRLAMGADFLNPAAAVELFAGTATKPTAFG